MAVVDRKAIPKLVGVTKAAEMLGTSKSNVSTFVRRGRLPAPIEVEGGRPVWPKAEVAQVARELAAERRRREAARKRREKRGG